MKRRGDAGGPDSGKHSEATGQAAELEASRLALQKRDEELARLRGELEVAVRRVEQERDLLARQLAEVDRMESVGRLAGRVAHEFNNMLGVILGFSELALHRVPMESPVCGDLEHIRGAAERATILVRKLLAMASRQPAAPRPFELNGAVDGLLDTLRQILGAGVELVWSPGGSAELVHMDSSHLSQLLTTTATAAREAMTGNGTFSIRTEAVTVGERPESLRLGAQGVSLPSGVEGWANAAVAPGTLAPGDYLELTLSDSGPGLDPEELADVFDPLRAELRSGRGGDFRFAAVAEIVRQNGGAIAAENVAEGGFALRIFLRRHTDQSQPSAATVALQRSSTEPQRTALVAEDEPALLTMLSTTLERMGFLVLSANSGNKALRANEVHAGRVDLLVADVVMPDLDGRLLADRLLALHPELKVLFVSGYPPDAVAEHGVRVEGVHFLQKPFSLRDFMSKIGEVLEPR